MTHTSIYRFTTPLLHTFYHKSTNLLIFSSPPTIFTPQSPSSSSSQLQGGSQTTLKFLPNFLTKQERLSKKSDMFIQQLIPHPWISALNLNKKNFHHHGFSPEIHSPTSRQENENSPTHLRLFSGGRTLQSGS